MEYSEHRRCIGTGGTSIERLARVAALVAVGGMWVAGDAWAGTFDGEWKVRTVTEVNKDHCARPPLWRYRVVITNGRLAPKDNNATEVLVGTVRDDGTLRVSIRRGEDRATAEGKLSDATGSGTWRSPTRNCSGTWTSERKTN